MCVNELLVRPVTENTINSIAASIMRQHVNIVNGKNKTENSILQPHRNIPAWKMNPDSRRECSFKIDPVSSEHYKVCPMYDFYWSLE
jgi:hypothetical protein